MPSGVGLASHRPQFAAKSNFPLQGSVDQLLSRAARKVTPQRHGLALGADPEIFTLWGDVVQTAANMATSALPSTVQVTEAAYRRLRGCDTNRRSSMTAVKIDEALVLVEQPP